MKDEDILISELEMKLKGFMKENQNLKQELNNLKRIIKDNELESDLEGFNYVSAEEEICIKGIEQILELVRNKTFGKEDIQNYDILHKNLRMIRNQPIEGSKKQKKTDVKELLKIVEGK